MEAKDALRLIRNRYEKLHASCLLRNFSMSRTVHQRRLFVSWSSGLIMLFTGFEDCNDTSGSRRWHFH